MSQNDQNFFAELLCRGLLQKRVGPNFSVGAAKKMQRRSAKKISIKNNTLGHIYTLFCILCMILPLSRFLMGSTPENGLPLFRARKQESFRLDRDAPNRIASGPSLRGCKPQVRRPKAAAVNPDWYVVRARPAAEYLAESEMRRVGMDTYLPQYKRASRHRRSKRIIVRMFPLFLGYLFTPARTLNLSALADCDGVARTDPIIADQFGRPLPLPDALIAKIRGNEECGAFDDLPGKHRLARGEPIQIADAPLMEGVIKSVRSLENVRLLVKLFNTEIEATVPVAKLRKAS